MEIYTLAGRIDSRLSLGIRLEGKVGQKLDLLMLWFLEKSMQMGLCDVGFTVLCSQSSEFHTLLAGLNMGSLSHLETLMFVFAGGFDQDLRLLQSELQD